MKSQISMVAFSILLFFLSGQILAADSVKKENKKKEERILFTKTLPPSQMQIVDRNGLYMKWVKNRYYRWEDIGFGENESSYGLLEVNSDIGIPEGHEGMEGTMTLKLWAPHNEKYDKLAWEKKIDGQYLERKENLFVVKKYGCCGVDTVYTYIQVTDGRIYAQGTSELLQIQGETDEYFISYLSFSAIEKKDLPSEDTAGFILFGDRKEIREKIQVRYTEAKDETFSPPVRFMVENKGTVEYLDRINTAGLSKYPEKKIFLHLSYPDELIIPIENERLSIEKAFSPKKHYPHKEKFTLTRIGQQK